MADGLISLEELKAQNAADEKAESDKLAAEIKAEEDALAAEDAEDEAAAKAEPKIEAKAEEGDDTATGGDEDPPKAESDDWMKSDDKPILEFSGSDMGKLRRKMKGRLTEVETEAEALRKENETLKQQLKTPIVQTGNLPTKPDRDKFNTDDDYQEALTNWAVDTRLANQSATAAAEQAKTQRAAQEAATASAVDAHYERAIALCGASKIAPEAFQAADRKLREEVDKVFPKGGDAITDNLLARLGIGSEKVAYSLGVNAQRRDKLINLLKEDRSGLSAAIYLGQLNAQTNAPASRQTAAPEPAERIQGDKAGGDKGNKLKREYRAAQKSGDVQAAFDIKQKAKGQKLDVSSW